MQPDDMKSISDKTGIRIGELALAVSQDHQGGGEGEQAPANQTPAPDPAHQSGWDDTYVRMAARHSKSAGKAQAEEADQLGEESQDPGDDWEGA